MRIGIVGGALQGMEAAYLAKKAGMTAVVIDRWPKAPAFSLADESEVVDVLDPEAHTIIDDCDVILPANEDPETLRVLVKLCRGGPPLIFDPRSYRISRSKLLSNKLFRTLGVPMPAPWPECGFPVVVKPSVQSGSVGVSRANNMSQLKDGIERARRLGEGVVVQEFITGRSVSLEVIGNGSDAVPLVTTEVHLDEDFDCKMVTSPPERLNFDEEALRDAGIEIARSLRLHGIMDVEAIVDKGAPKVIEIDARIPSQTPSAVYHSHGINMVEALAELFVHGRMPSPPRAPKRHAIYEHLLIENGVVRSKGEGMMAGFARMKVVEGLFGSDEMITSYGPEKTRWAATVICTGSTPSEARRKRQACLREIMEVNGLKRHCDLAPVVRV